MRVEKGITLIALVITIIVLLILAGVAIAVLTGENGLLKRAEEAKLASQNAQIAENSTLYNYENTIDGYFSGTGGNENNSESIGNDIVVSQELKSILAELNHNTITFNDIKSSNLVEEMLSNEKISNYLINNENYLKILSNSDFTNFNNRLFKVPKLSSNNSNVFYSSALSSAYQAFDENNDTYWYSNDTTEEQYIGYKFEEQITPFKISIVNLKYSSYYRAKTFQIQGSIDGSEYFDLTDKLILEENSNIQEFYLKNLEECQYIRMMIYDKYTDAKLATGICELRVYGRNKVK